MGLNADESALLLREAGKGDARSAAGWGMESWDGSAQARALDFAIRLASRRRPIPHPAFGHLPQQS